MMIRLKNVEKQYKNFHLDCSMEIQEGMVTGLAGANGAGLSGSDCSSLSMCCKNYGAPGVLIKLNKLIDIFFQHGKMYTKLDCIQ